MRTTGEIYPEISFRAASFRMYCSVKSGLILCNCKFSLFCVDLFTPEEELYTF